MGNLGLEWTLITTPVKFKEVSAAPTGIAIIANTVQVYAKDKSGTSALYLKDDAGSEREIAPANTVTGTGTANRLAYWSSSSVLAANAALTQNRISFADSNGLPTDNAKLTVDLANNLVSIGGGYSLAASGVRALELFGTGTEALSSLVRLTSNGTGTASNFQGRASRGTAGTPTAMQADDIVTLLSSLPYGATGYASGRRAAVTLRVAENQTDSAQGSYATIETTPTGSTTAAERFRIGPSGQWGIGGATFGTTLDVFTSGGASAAPTWTSPGALTKVDDTNVTLTLGGTPTTALLRAASLTLGWTGQLAISRGGTGASTALAAFNALSPLTTRGDLLTRDASNNVRLAVGAANTVLKSNGTDPSWLDYTTDWLSQYALLAGRSGGQTLKGGTAVGDALNLQPTSGNGVGAEWIKFLVGNNGATEAARFGSQSASPLWLFNETAFKASGLVSGAALEMHLGTNANFSLAKGDNFTDGFAGACSFQAYNDAVNANTPLEFRASIHIFNIGPLAIVDGITAPSTQSGFAQIYVDTADGDLKVKFGDGTVKTIVTDT